MPQDYILGYFSAVPTGLVVLIQTRQSRVGWTLQNYVGTEIGVRNETLLVVSSLLSLGRTSQEVAQTYPSIPCAARNFLNSSSELIRL